MQQAFAQIHRRSDAQQRSSLPLGVRSVAHGRFEAGAYEERRRMSYVKVLWCVWGAGVVDFGGGGMGIKPGQIAVYTPDTLHSCQAAGPGLEMRWWTMNGQVVEPILSGFGFGGSGVYEAGPAPVELFARLVGALSDPTPSGLLQADVAGYELLARAAGHPHVHAQDPRIEQALTLIRQRWSDPGLSVKTLAAALGEHRSSFSRRFHRVTGLWPHDYLTDLRLQRALGLLEGTRLPVATIARQCGYADPSYFARLFRQRMGLSPRACRGG